MKKILQALCSVCFVTTMALPADALANNVEELNDATEEQVTQTAEPDDYHLAFLSGDFCLEFSHAPVANPFPAMVMYVTNPEGKIIKDAQIVTTTIDQNGAQLMARARRMKGGYLIDTAHLQPGPYRLEMEIITDGRLLTDALLFQKT